LSGFVNQELVLTGMPSKLVEQRSQRHSSENEDYRTQNRCRDAGTTLESELSNILERLLPSSPDKHRPRER
jgi:hypothetical protein